MLIVFSFCRNKKKMSDEQGQVPPENNPQPPPQQEAPDEVDESQKPHRRSKRSLIDVPTNNNYGPDGEPIEEF